MVTGSAGAGLPARMVRVEVRRRRPRRRPGLVAYAHHAGRATPDDARLNYALRQQRAAFKASGHSPTPDDVASERLCELEEFRVAISLDIGRLAGRVAVLEGVLPPTVIAHPVSANDASGAPLPAPPEVSVEATSRAFEGMLLAPPAVPSEAVAEASEASHVAPAGPSEEVAPTAVTSPRIRRSKVAEVVACVGDGPRQADVAVGALTQPSPPATQVPVDVMGIVLGELAPAVPAGAKRHRRCVPRRPVEDPDGALLDAAIAEARATHLSLEEMVAINAMEVTTDHSRPLSQDFISIPLAQSAFFSADQAVDTPQLASDGLVPTGRKKPKKRSNKVALAVADDDAILDQAVLDVTATPMTLADYIKSRVCGPCGHKLVIGGDRFCGLQRCLARGPNVAAPSVAVCVSNMCGFGSCYSCLETTNNGCTPEVQQSA